VTGFDLKILNKLLTFDHKTLRSSLQLHAFGRERDFPRGAVKKLGVERCFECLNAAREDRTRYPEGVGGGCEVQSFRHTEKGAEGSEQIIHKNNVPRIIVANDTTKMAVYCSISKTFHVLNFCFDSSEKMKLT
jgi:hypothetical protein